MKISIATFFLILPFAYGFEFASARDINLCARLINKGWGWGREEYSTGNARCLDARTMRLNCDYTLPATRVGQSKYHNHNCDDKESCVPHLRTFSPTPDAGCLVLFSPSGVKGEGDMDNHACSSGVQIGKDDIYILSSISPDGGLYLDGIRACIIGKSGSKAPKDTIFQGSPCPKTSKILKLAAHTTYQACIDTVVALANKKVGFHWNIRSPGNTFHYRRGLQQQGKPLSEMFTIVGNNTANDALRIVIGDQEIGDGDGGPK
ncbi:hypothetical protein EG328_001117 [Venturia inaequalis]|uniref:Uncharacterized protein n=1 Tax=Venturia inaequalis TaxID=5025 RepID=A0A8H3V0J0_VENIN|nr:hypothetical protein EG328_001117 [Venturia inaequalis]KAE9993553.1 hypothetical protein EG327_004564 [Venturia inaequalis]